MARALTYGFLLLLACISPSVAQSSATIEEQGRKIFGYLEKQQTSCLAFTKPEWQYATRAWIEEDSKKRLIVGARIFFVTKTGSGVCPGYFTYPARVGNYFDYKFNCPAHATPGIIPPSGVMTSAFEQSMRAIADWVDTMNEEK